MELLAKNYLIEVYSWNTGTRGDEIAPADFRVMSKFGDRTIKKLSLDQVVGIIKGDININNI